MDESKILKNYERAKEEYASLGVDTEKALKEFSEIKISLHCWQGDFRPQAINSTFTPFTRRTLKKAATIWT